MYTTSTRQTSDPEQTTSKSLVGVCQMTDSRSLVAVVFLIRLPRGTAASGNACMRVYCGFQYCKNVASKKERVQQGVASAGHLANWMQNVLGPFISSGDLSNSFSSLAECVLVADLYGTLTVVGFALGVFGLNRFKKKDRLNIDKFTTGFLENKDGLTEDNWPVYSIAAGVGAALGWTWLLLLPFTMLVLQAAVKMVQNLLEVTSVASIFMLVMLLWLALWMFGAAGVVALSTGDGGRWWLLVIRGLRSKIGKNGCLLCCVDFLFHLVEFLVRWFNKYAYVQQFGLGLKHPERVVMVGSIAMLVGMILVGLAVVVVESAVYSCYAEDPTLINRWDAVFFTQISEKLHQRLQHRSLRPRELLRRSADEETPEVVLS
ncbi:hypothetical protein Sango_0106900 [Sesamum angolense]|uniref:Uncharacterized protein n=1 Tax=Sesamum angolense TaxID=2727404 RepID=A0AAE1XF93_9LAMI|nr:hypothetical protein Sango_0106900 [Sesamum angolense]